MQWQKFPYWSFKWCIIPWQRGPEKLLKHPLLQCPEIGSQLVLLTHFVILQVKLHSKPKYPKSQSAKETIWINIFSDEFYLSDVFDGINFECHNLNDSNSETNFDHTFLLSILESIRKHTFHLCGDMALHSDSFRMGKNIFDHIDLSGKLKKKCLLYMKKYAYTFNLYTFCIDNEDIYEWPRLVTLWEVFWVINLS